jgi:hypothetical protein
MTRQSPQPEHPLAPEETGPAPHDNRVETVKARAGVEIGAMRYVLLGGLVLALLGFLLAWGVAA